MSSEDVYIVNCWHCTAAFNAYEVSFCNHKDPTKICPFCLKCSCDAPQSYKDNLIKQSPARFQTEKKRLLQGKDTRLGEMLVKSGKILQSQLIAAIMEQEQLRKPLGEIIVKMGLLTEAELRLFLSEQKEIEEINLDKFELDMALVEKIGKPFCLRYHVIPLDFVKIDIEWIFRFAISSKEDWKKLKASFQATDVVLVPYLAPKEQVDRLLEEIEDESILVLK